MLFWIETIYLFDTIKLSRNLPDNLKSFISPVIQRNGFFGCSENILIAMLADERKRIKENALNQTTTENGEIRIFKVPALNYDSEQNINLIDWKSMT